MWSTPPLPLLPGSLWSGGLVPVSVLSLGQIELFEYLTMSKQMNNCSVLELDEMDPTDILQK